MTSFLNEAGWDRIARVVIGIALLSLGFASIVVGTAGVVVKIVGVLLVATGVVGWCPAYTLFRFRTNKKPPVSA